MNAKINWNTKGFNKLEEFNELDDCFSELSDNIFVARINMNAIMESINQEAIINGNAPDGCVEIHSEIESLLRKSNDCIDFIKKAIAN